LKRATREERGIEHHQPVLSGNNPGIQREAGVAEKARRNGARVLSEGERALFEQGRDDTTRLAVAGADDVGGVRTREFAAIKYSFEVTPDFGGK
jgi:hypothetical protein